MADRIQELRALHTQASEKAWKYLATPSCVYQLAPTEWADAAKTSLPLLLDVAEAAGELEQANAAMCRLLESGGHTGEEFDAIAERQHGALMVLRTALAALEGE